MTPTTRIVREQAFLALECDIPEGMTVDQYRRSRRASRRRRMLRLRRR
jgi:hypothetical protein